MSRNFNFHHPINASMHYNRAIISFQKAFNPHCPDGSYLFYTCLELRICIERLLFEYLVIMSVEEEKINKFMNKYRVKDISKAIYESEPEFNLKLEYTNFFLKTLGVNFEIPIPNMSKLNSCYGRLGNYLHNFKKPSESVQNQEWWITFIHLLEETREYLSEFLAIPRAFLKMNEKGLKLYEDYKNKSVSLEEIRKKILED